MLCCQSDQQELGSVHRSEGPFRGRGGLGVKVKLRHTKRRSSLGEQVADYFDKGEVKQAEALVELKESKKIGISKVLSRWFNNIRPEIRPEKRCLQEVVYWSPLFIREISLKINFFQIH